MYFYKQPSIKLSQFDGFVLIAQMQHQSRFVAALTSKQPACRQPNSFETVQHSRSRDKSRRLPKTKKGKPQRHRPYPSPFMPADFSKNLVVLANQGIHKLATYLQTEDDDNLRNDAGKVDVPSVAQPASQVNVLAVKKFNVLPQPVYQGWQQNTSQIPQKGKQVHQPVPTTCRPQVQITQKQQTHFHSNPVLVDASDRSSRRIQNYSDLKQRFKSKMCYDFWKGKCRKPAELCTYAHGCKDLKPDCRANYLCRNFLKGICTKTQQQCKFYHQRPKGPNPGLQSSSLASDEQRKRQPQSGPAVKNQERKELSNKERQNHRRQQRKEERGQQKKEDKRQQRQDHKNNKIQELKESKLSQQNQQKKIADRVLDKLQDIKKYAQTSQNMNSHDINAAYMIPLPYFSINNSYFPNQPKQSANQRKQSANQPKQLANQPKQVASYPSPASTPSNLYESSSLSSPMYYSPSYALPQQNSFYPSQMSNYMLDQQFNYQGGPNYPQNYSMQSANGSFMSPFLYYFPQGGNPYANKFSYMSNDIPSYPHLESEQPLFKLQQMRQRYKQDDRQQFINKPKDRRQGKLYRR